MLTFEQFKTNVERWQAERGIYEHSTALAQALKAVSEAGELADAVIKGDRDALKDSVGDVMVCAVGVAKMSHFDIDFMNEGQCENDWSQHQIASIIASCVTDICTSVSCDEHPSMLIDPMCDLFYWLDTLAKRNDLTLMECCEAAWNEIKDRKGHMVAGGAFVKDE